MSDPSETTIEGGVGDETVAGSPPPPSPPEHTSERPPSGYVYMSEGCRCPDCTDAYADMRAKAAEGRKKPGAKKPGRKPRKGTTAGRVTEEIRAEATKGPKPRGKSKAISEDAWIDLTGRALVYLSLFFAMYVLFWTDQRDNDELTEYLALSEDEATTIGTPFARLLHRSPLNTRYGRDFVEHFDIVAALMAVAMYLRRVGPYMAQSRRYRANIKQAKKAGVENPASVTPIRRPSARRQEAPPNGTPPTGTPQSADSQAPPSASQPGGFTPGDQFRTT